MFLATTSSHGARLEVWQKSKTGFFCTSSENGGLQYSSETLGNSLTEDTIRIMGRNHDKDYARHESHS